MKILWRFCIYSVTIFAEKYFSFLIPIRFDRSTANLQKNPDKLITTLKKHLPIRSIVSSKSLNVVGNEKGKGRYVSGLGLIYEDQNNEQQRLEVVIKHLSSRNEPMFLSSLKSAVFKGIDREVLFYNLVSQHIPVRTPRSIYADQIPLLYRGIIVMERLNPDFLVDDYNGCLLEQSHIVLNQLARMHAKYWGQIRQNVSTRWLPEKHSLDIHWFMPLITRKEKTCRSLWQALRRRFTDRPLTLTHGDARPGNMMWFNDQSVAFLDWQFVHAGIGIWDAAYFIVMGHDVDLRRKSEDEMIHNYYDKLTHWYHEYHSAKIDYDLTQCLNDFQHLKLVLGLYGWAALVSRMFDKYGNDPRDVQAWADRITSAVTDLESDSTALKLEISPKVINGYKSIMIDATQQTKERFRLENQT